MNPYAVLGVKKTADIDAIDKAYRRRRRQLHQAGADDAALKELNEAYETLRHEGKRDHYDRTGETGFGSMEQFVDTELVSYLGAVFEEVLIELVEKGGDMASAPMLAKVVQKVCEGLNADAARIAGYEKLAADLEANKARWRLVDKSSGTDNLFHVFTARSVKELAARRAEAERQKATKEAALTLLREYEYDQDRREERWGSSKIMRTRPFWTAAAAHTIDVPSNLSYADFMKMFGEEEKE